MNQDNQWRPDGQDGWGGAPGVQYPSNGHPISQGQQFDFSMPQPTYANGFPQPIRPPMRHSSAMAGFATSKSFKTGLSSILWLLFGWILFIGPLISLIQGIRAVIKGIKELVRAHYTEGFGRGAAVLGIVLGLIGGGISGLGTFMIGRAFYIVSQAEMNDQEVVLEEDEDTWNLFVRGEARLVDKDSYDYDDTGYDYADGLDDMNDSYTEADAMPITDGSGNSYDDMAASDAPIPEIPSEPELGMLQG